MEFPLVPERCALLVNDLEEKMVCPSSPFYIPTAVEALVNLLPLVDFCRRRGIPGLFALIGSEQTREKGAARIELPEGAVIDLSLCRLADRLGSHPDDFVFVKTWRSGCIGDVSVDYLKRRNRDTVIVAGTTLQFGCDTTVREASKLGFQVAALSDCCASRPIADQGWGEVGDDEVIKVFFSTWKKAFARVMTAGEALRELDARAGG